MGEETIFRWHFYDNSNNNSEKHFLGVELSLKLSLLQINESIFHYKTNGFMYNFIKKSQTEVFQRNVNTNETTILNVDFNDYNICICTSSNKNKNTNKNSMNMYHHNNCHNNSNIFLMNNIVSNKNHNLHLLNYDRNIIFNMCNNSSSRNTRTMRRIENRVLFFCFNLFSLVCNLRINCNGKLQYNENLLPFT